MKSSRTFVDALGWGKHGIYFSRRYDEEDRDQIGDLTLFIVGRAEQPKKVAVVQTSQFCLLYAEDDSVKSLLG